MAFNKSAIAWNLGALAAGAWGMAVFAQSNAVDLYGAVAQLKKTWGDLVVLTGTVSPFVTAGVVAYRTYGMKQVPSNAVAAVPLPGNPAARNVAMDENHMAVPVPGISEPVAAKIVT